MLKELFATKKFRYLALAFHAIVADVVVSILIYRGFLMKTRDNQF